MRMTPNLDTVHIYGVPLLVMWGEVKDINHADFHIHLDGECIEVSAEVKVMIASQLEHRMDGDRRAH